MAPIFDAYIMVDWSAASKPVTGENAIWIGQLQRDKAGQMVFKGSNPATRAEAIAQLKEALMGLIKDGHRVLVGFDFAFGYPTGTAEVFGLNVSQMPAWQAMHQALSTRTQDGPGNQNNRFAVAAALNQAGTGGPHPFWGVPPRQACNTLQPKKGDFSALGSLPEARLAEDWIAARFKARPKSVWQLLGAGAVGGQSLLGIPAVSKLRGTFPQSRIWPFETGLKPLTRARLGEIQCLFCEVYPSTLKPARQSDEAYDLTQVRTLAERFCEVDRAGELGQAFAAPETLEPEKTAQIETEEGWILAI